MDDDFFELIDLSFEELEISEEEESSDNTVISVLDSGEQLAFVEGVKADELTGFYFFPFSSDEEAELGTLAQQEDITSESESSETDDVVTQEDDIASESESSETDDVVAQQEDITSESESSETDDVVAQQEDINSESESSETDDVVTQEDDIASESESSETDDVVAQQEDINSESESTETDESDNSVTEEAIASNSPKEEETDTITGEEVSTEIDDELLNGDSDSPSDNTDEFLLAGDDLASIREIEVQELTTSDNNMIEDDLTTGSRTIETAERDRQDPVLAAIDTNDVALV